MMPSMPRRKFNRLFVDLGFEDLASHVSTAEAEHHAVEAKTGGGTFLS